MAQIKLTLPLSIGGILGHPITKQQQWAHCILDIEKYYSIIWDYMNTKGMSELQQQLFLRACEYVWHAYHCSDPMPDGQWLRFETERNAREVWRLYTNKFLCGEPLDRVELNEQFQRELYNIVHNAMVKRGEKYVAVATECGGPEPIARAIVATHEELRQGPKEPCWGLFDHETHIFFPIEGESILQTLHKQESVPGIKSIYLLSPEQRREVHATFTGENARECLWYAMHNVSGHAELLTRWVIEETYKNELERDFSTTQKLANTLMATVWEVIDELFNKSGRGLLQLYYPEYKNRKYTPIETLMGDILKFIVELINKAIQEYDAGKSLSAHTIKEYVRHKWLYPQYDDDNEEIQVVPQIWKACIYGQIPNYWENWEL